MKRFRLSTDATSDIKEIWSYVAADSPIAARKLRLSLLDACHRLADNPGMGHTRQDLTDQPVLFWPVSSYFAIYDPALPARSRSSVWSTALVTFQRYSDDRSLDVRSTMQARRPQKPTSAESQQTTASKLTLNSVAPTTPREWTKDPS